MFSYRSSAMVYGERTLPEAIDVLSVQYPDRTWARYPATSEDFERGVLQEVTFSALAHAIDALAWYLHGALPANLESDIVLYLGPSDIQYFIVACAACKCNLKVLFSSPRNNLEAHGSLVHQTGSQIFLRPRDHPLDRTLETLVSEHNLRTVEIPPLDELFNFPADAWTKDYCRDFASTFVVLHTSGSTGTPKAVSVTHGLYATLDAQQGLATDDKRLNVREWADRSVFVTLPPFHAAALNFFGWSVFHGSTLVLGPADRPPSASTIEHALDLGLGDLGVTAPSILEECVQNEYTLSKFSRWSSISFGGGPLSSAAGNALWKKTRVHTLLGSTETNTLPEFVPLSEDEWPYHNFHPSLGVEFRLCQDNLHEAVIVRHSRWRTEQAVFWTFPQLDEYPMKDIYEQHPSKPGLWAYHGRIDDIIVLSNGEKFSPVEAESIVARGSGVKSAMIVGNTHDQSALLVELSEPNMQGNRLVECRRLVMDLVQQANKSLPDHAQIHVSHVKILSPPHGFLRSAKGELRRAPTAKLLESEISQLYASAEAGNGSSNASDLDFTDRSKLVSCLTFLLSDEAYLGRVVDPDANIFQCGFDSLKAMKLLRHIKTSLNRQSLEPTSLPTPKTIYHNPSSVGLADALLRRMSRCPDSDDDATKETHMNQILAQFSQKIGSLAQSTMRRQAVVITGSTGSLGSYLLDRLLGIADVDQVVCLNRDGSDESRQASLHEARGLTTDFSRVTFLEADLSKYQLGLREESYRDLILTTTHVIHNAWPVDFNLSLSSFQPQLEGCLNLLALAKEMRSLQNLSFVSSVGVATGWAKKYPGEVPESKIEDLDMPEGMGYGQSKLLAELLFAHGRDALNVPVSICRIGQIAGPVMSHKGMWSRKEWFPSIILSCKHLRKVPADLGALNCIDWIPVDTLADAVAEALLSESSAAKMTDKTRYMHFVNPSKISWTDIAHKVSSLMGENLEVVPFDDWLNSLVAASEATTVIESMPAIKLIDFLKDMARNTKGAPSFSTEKTQARSPTLASLSPLSMDWMEQWFRQWMAS